MYLRDGETISHEIKENQTISYYYLNEGLEKQSIYFSFSVDDPIALKKLKMSIYYFQEVEGILLKS